MNAHLMRAVGLMLATYSVSCQVNVPDATTSGTSFACRFDNECSAGFRCATLNNTVGQCVANDAARCDSNSPCTGFGYVCRSGACVNPCMNVFCSTGSCQVDTDGIGRCKTTTGTSVSCGNGMVDNGEACDGFDVHGATCAGVLGSTFSGVVTCNGNCSLNTTQCGNGGNLCGNNQVDPGESCDGNALSNQTCMSKGFQSGVLRCGSGCSFDTSGCSNTTSGFCGDGQVNGSEQCDGNALNGKQCSTLNQDFAGGTLTCNSSTCQYNTAQCNHCGDSQVQAGESCDGSNLTGKTCGDLISGRTGSLSCSGACTFDTRGCTCGNNMLDSGEQCDGNIRSGYSCASYGFASGTLGCTSCQDDTSACTNWYDLGSGVAVNPSGQGARFPSMVLGDSGNPSPLRMVAWLQEDAGTPAQVHAAMWTGSSWTNITSCSGSSCPMTRVNNNFYTSNPVGPPTIAYGNDGMVRVAWSDGGDIYLAKQGLYGWLTENGQSFSTYAGNAVMTSNDPSVLPTIAINEGNSNGPIFTFWQEEMGTGQRVYAREATYGSYFGAVFNGGSTSTNSDDQDGVSSNSVALPSATAPNATQPPFAQPSAMVDLGGNLWVAWTGASLGTSPPTPSVYVRRLALGGNTWLGTGTGLGNQSDQGFGVSATGGTPRAASQVVLRTGGYGASVAFLQDNGSAQRQVVYKRYNSNTDSWEAPLASSPQTSKVGSINASGVSMVLDDAQNPIIAWTELSSGTSQIKVVHWNGSSWQMFEVGDDNPVGVSHSTYAAVNPVLVTRTGTHVLCLAWEDQTSSTASHQIMVRCRDGI